MEIEEKQVLLNPLTRFFKLRQKEWWYSGAYQSDPDGDFYISWYIVRIHLADQFVMSVFDPNFAEPVHIKPILFTKCARPAGRLSLNGRTLAGGIKFGYNGAFRRDSAAPDYDGWPDAGAGSWELQVESKEVSGQIQIDSTIPYFTKFDHKIKDHYGMMHFFHNRANGVIHANGRDYRLNNALTYYDHCWGRIPAKPGWHWIAVQNETAAIASLINYGPYAQLYTEIFFTVGVKSPRTGEWVRLSQTVSFEYRRQHKWAEAWHVSSPDMVLEVELLQRKTDRTWIPIFVNISHTEVFVKVSGQVRVDGEWVETGDMFGVMEEQRGRW